MASHDPQKRPEPTATTENRRRYHHPAPLPIHPTPDPTVITAPPSTVQNISQRFSKLYANHKKLAPMPSKPHPDLQHPQPEEYFQQKPITYSPISDTSRTTLTKSSSHNGRKCAKKHSLSENVPKKPPFEEFDADEAKKSTPKSLQSHEEVVKKRIQAPPPQGFNTGGRRKSFCSSPAELADFLSCSGVRVVAVDMPPSMQIHAVDCARKARDSLEKFASKALALTLKKEFDGVYGPAWHCIVGSNFGSFVTHSLGGFMYFSMDHKLYILLFKTNVQRAE